jgi:Spy/CpxP family protein refolding chaperone
MRHRGLTLACGFIFTLGAAGLAVAQDNGAQPPAQEQQMHAPRSIDQQLARLTKDLELTAEQQKQVRPLLQEHHDRIQALLDKNPNATRQELAPQIHAISADTHHQINALLTDHQKQLEKTMRQREHNGQENRRPDAPASGSGDSSPSPS